MKEGLGKWVVWGCGRRKVGIKRLREKKDDWVGCVFWELREDVEVKEDEVGWVVEEVGMNMEYVLGEYKK